MFLAFFFSLFPFAIPSFSNKVVNVFYNWLQISQLTFSIFLMWNFLYFIIILVCNLIPTFFLCLSSLDNPFGCWDWGQVKKIWYLILTFCSKFVEGGLLCMDNNEEMYSSSWLVYVRVHDRHWRPKSYKLKFESLSPKEVDCDCLPTGMCVSPITGMGLHMRVGVKEHDIFCGPKSYKFKLLGHLVVQQCSLYNINEETVNNLLLSYNIKSYGPLQWGGQKFDPRGGVGDQCLTVIKKLELMINIIPNH